jgi:hypothetical protein
MARFGSLVIAAAGSALVLGLARRRKTDRLEVSVEENEAAGVSPYLLLRNPGRKTLRNVMIRPGFVESPAHTKSLTVSVECLPPAAEWTIPIPTAEGPPASLSFTATWISDDGNGEEAFEITWPSLASTKAGIEDE